jgi:segregation and condensation protein B
MEERMSLTMTEELSNMPSSGRGDGAESDVPLSMNGDEGTEHIDRRELTAILEALLFVSSDPVPLTRLVSLLGNVKKAEVEQALAQLSRDFEQEGRGLQLVQVAGGYRLVTKPDFAPWIKKLDKAKSLQKLSRSALESLAIIAYKQPLVRSEIEQIRGVETSGVLRTLLERKLVRIVGRKEVPGRPIMYGTTKFFLEHFGLHDLTQLPPLREFKELGEAEQAMLPIDEHALYQQAAGTTETVQESSPDSMPIDEGPEANGVYNMAHEVVESV